MLTTYIKILNPDPESQDPWSQDPQNRDDDLNLKIPSYATEHSAGMDLSSCSKEDIVIKPMEIMLVPTGIAIEIPSGFEAQVRPRSGLALKYGISIPNAPGTIDADYRGEIKIMLINLGKNDFTVTYGMRIAQMIIAKYEKVSWKVVEELSDTVRGTAGFGSTGT